MVLGDQGINEPIEEIIKHQASALKSSFSSLETNLISS